MLKMIQSFIHKLQNSDENTKKFWLILLSSLTMAVVVGGWVTYLNLTVAGVSSQIGRTAEVAVEIKEDAPGIFAIFGAGVKTIYDEVRERLAKRSIIIENPQRNFVADEVEEIPPTKLR